jgi:hypothetical protein
MGAMVEEHAMSPQPNLLLTGSRNQALEALANFAVQDLIHSRGDQKRYRKERKDFANVAKNSCPRLLENC